MDLSSPTGLAILLRCAGGFQYREVPLQARSLRGPLRLTRRADVLKSQIARIGLNIDYVAQRFVSLRRAGRRWASQRLYVRQSGVAQCIVIHSNTGRRAARARTRTKVSLQYKCVLLVCGRQCPLVSTIPTIMHNLSVIRWRG